MSAGPPPVDWPLLRAKRLPSLDGWRAVSIALVVGSHCPETPGFPPALRPVFEWGLDGSLGVRFFFMISGFIISWLMLQEDRERGRVDLSRFYLRRAIRILPVYFVFLTTLALLACFTPFSQAWWVWLGNLTFATNYVSNPTWTSGHLWSLAVEEQFYLLWPILFVWLDAGRRPRIAAWILIVPIVVAPMCRVLSYLRADVGVLQPLLSWYSFFNFSDTLSLGCIGAMLLARHGDAVHRWLVLRPRLILACALVLIAVPHVCFRLLTAAPLSVPLGFTMQAAGILVLVLQSVVSPRFGFYPLLNLPAVRWLGLMSYSLYIWQQLFCTRPEVFGWEAAWWLSFPTWIPVALLVAIVSYYALERPLLVWRSRWR